MIRLLKLYSNPQIFDPISFEPGVNIILGEKAEGNKKTNGVGKSMSIEFINFCLLTKKDDSRVMKIPDNIFPSDTQIILDLIINDQPISIIRTKKDPDKPIFIIEQNPIYFNSLDDATKHITILLFSGEQGLITPSFRQLLAPLIRDERSEFKDIIQCFNTIKRIPPDYIPHLYLLGIDLSLYKNAKGKLDDISKNTEYLRELKKRILTDDSKKISDVKAELNGLNDEVQKLGQAIESLRSNEAFDSIQKDLINIETELDQLRTREKAVRYDIKKMKSLPEPEFIDETDIAIVYNQFKQGLGDIIAKSLEEVKHFKEKIDSFRQGLVNEKLELLNSELNNIATRIGRLDLTYSEKLKSIDNGKVLKDLRTGLAIYNKKSEELNLIRYQIVEYDKTERNQKLLKSQKDQLVAQLETNLDNARLMLDSFNGTILDIHDFIMGNKEAFFDVQTKVTNKEVIQFTLRIHDDGSHSIERSKVFIYDLALMFNENTRQKHPGLLIHDNIFDVDQDTLIKSLNYLAKQEDFFPNGFQYILTLNRDKIENEEITKEIKLDINQHRRAKFTKDNKFLKSNYKEK
jgi:uncharacterized protein YydD (DUF2326 family)